MAQSFKVEALVLARRSIGEADRLAFVLTREYGLMRLLAKGVRKIPSRRGGHLEPFTRVVAVVHPTHGYHYAAGMETLDHYPRLAAAPEALRRAQILAAAVLHTLPEEEVCPPVYQMMEYAWHHLPELSLPKQALLEIACLTVILLTAGLAPRLEHCIQCAVGNPSEAVVLDGRLGGWVCLSCKESFHGAEHSLSPRLLKALRYIARYPEQALRLRLSPDEGDQLQQGFRYYTGVIIEQPWLMSQPV